MVRCSAVAINPVLGLRLRCLEMLRFREQIDAMTDNQRAELDALIAKLGDAAIFDREDWASLSVLPTSPIILSTWILTAESKGRPRPEFCPTS